MYTIRKMMKKIILMLIIILCVGNVFSINSFYKIDLNKQNESIYLNNLEVIFDNKDLLNKNGLGGYIAEVEDKDFNILNWTFFTISDSVLYDYLDENNSIIGGGKLQFENINQTIYVPYYKNATLIKIYDNRYFLQFEINVSKYTQNTKNIFEDENLIINNSSQIENLVENENQSTSIFNYKLILILIGILILIYVIYIRHLKKTNY